MFCPRCGANLPDDAAFCGNCGTGIPRYAAPMPAAAAVGTTVAPVAASRGASKRPLIIGLAAAAIIIAAVIAAGLLTSWFGLAKDDAVYVVAKQTVYGSDGKTDVIEYTRDQQGNISTAVMTSYVNGDAAETTRHTYIHDQNGYVSERSFERVGQGTVKQSAHYDSVMGADGKMIFYECKITTEDLRYDPAGTTVNEGTGTNEYHPNGHVMKSSSNYVSTVTNMGGLYGDYESRNTSSYEYDDRGYILSSEATWSNWNGSGEPSTATWNYSWEFDASGKPTACTGRAVRGDTSKEQRCTFDTDSAGNITAVYDENGNKTAEFEYMLIEDPSLSIEFNHTFSPMALGI